jgi:hypothetical protein
VPSGVPTGSVGRGSREFGLKPRKVPAPPTPEQVAERVAKNKATRAARHTLGPLQKAKITGATAPARG